MPTESTTLAAVLFTDIVGSTEAAAEMGDRRWQELLRRHHAIVRRELRRFGGREIDTAGDGFFATFPRPAAAIRCAAAVEDAVRELGIDVRAGVHVGEVEVRGRKLGGMAVHIGARISGLAGPGEVLATVTAKDLVPGAGFGFEDRGTHQLKGVPGTWAVLAVTSIDGRGRSAPPSPEVARERRDAIQPPPPLGRHRWLAVLVGALVVAAVAFAAFFRDGSGEEPEPTGIPPNSLVEVDPSTGELLATVSGLPARARSMGLVGPGSSRQPVAVGEGAVWVLADPLMVHVDPTEREVEEVIQVGHASAVAVDFQTVWVGTQHSVTLINPADNKVLEDIRLPEDPLLSSATGLPGDLETGEGAVWEAYPSGGLVRIDPANHRVKVLEPGGAGHTLAVGEGAVWVADQLQGTLTRVDPDRGETVGEALRVTGSLDALVAGEGRVWILDKGAGTVLPVDPESGPGTPQPVGEVPTDLAVGLGAAWVADRDGTITRIDAGTLQSTRIEVDGQLAGLAIDQESETIWALITA